MFQLHPRPPALAQVLMLAVALAWPASSALAQSVPAEVQARAQTTGSARIIVEFGDPGFAPGLQRRNARALDKAAMQRAGDQLEARVRGRSRSPEARRLRRFQDLPLMALEASSADLDLLAAAPEVVAIYPDKTYKPLLNASQPAVGADDAAAAGFGGSGWAVAVLDTGTDKTHPTFGGRVVDEACFSIAGDCPGGATSLLGPGSGVNCTFETGCFHGTHVSGIAAGENTTYTGMVPMAKLVSVNIFSQLSGVQDCGAPGTCLLAFTSDIIAGLQFVRLQANANVAAVNLSLGAGQYFGTCDGQDPPLTAEFANVRAAGIAPIAASGNDGFTNAINLPACISHVISVGSVTGSNGVWTDSNSSSSLDLLAPGVSIRSSVPPALFGGAQFLDSTGTSMAAPHVAGAFAAMRSANASITVDAGLQTLINTGLPVFDARNGITRQRIRVDQAIHTLAPGNCFNGLDDDLDGQTDFPQDAGCRRGSWVENPACQDGVDNDGDGKVDYPADNLCSNATDKTENSNCGLGFELVLIIPAVQALRRIRRQQRS